MIFYYIAKAIIRNAQGKVLLVKRSKSNPRSPGKWTIPGGHCEEGESFAACCIREIKEETGLTIMPTKAVFTKIVDGKEGDVQLIHVVFESIWLNEKHENVALSNEHEAYAWGSLDEIQL